MSTSDEDEEDNYDSDPFAFVVEVERRSWIRVAMALRPALDGLALAEQNRASAGRGANDNATTTDNGVTVEQLLVLVHADPVFAP
ncbi:hypothetical protein OC842_002474 [Tilletia horrida]|uniref:Uncharacterized protein n=1 Tax=Tilletia horrida TaxID=155126 RepID=A0AAN6GD48_9BASI|nr:hypothetical protein OC842_002474 [Tilletia horrida]